MRKIVTWPGACASSKPCTTPATAAIDDMTYVIGAMSWRQYVSAISHISKIDAGIEHAAAMGASLHGWLYLADCWHQLTTMVKPLAIVVEKIFCPVPRRHQLIVHL
jgi:hypothetical protein